VLVATTIMGIAVGTLLAALSTSLRNASRLTESDRAAVLARRVVDSLLVEPQLPAGRILEGRWDRNNAGFDGGWRARVEPFETAPGVPPTAGRIDRLVLEIWWMNGETRRSFLLEAFRPSALPGVVK
jgi:hypothetical protein